MGTLTKTIEFGELLKRCKANSKTFYNLHNDDKEYFQKVYNGLKKKKNKLIQWGDFQEERLQRKLNGDNIDYIKKIRAMEFLNYQLPNK